jgi:peptidyl-prolyl cis-trans isomerase SurA
MKWSSAGALLACAGLIFAADPKNNANAPDNSDFAVVDQIVAKVNGDIITQTELQKTARDTIATLQQQQQLSGERLKDAYQENEKNFLRNRIDQLLLVQRGKELDLNVDSDVSKYLADLQRQEKIADPDKFHDFIRQQLGMSFEDFKQEVKNNMMTRQVIGREVASRINIPESEIEAYYNSHKNEFVRDEQVFLREILVSTDNKNTAAQAAAQKKAMDLYTRASKGERFADLARDNSDATTAPQGGDLGGFKKGALSKQIEDAVWKMQPGEVSKPMKVEHGWLILKVEEHTKQGQASLAEVQDEIREKLYEPKMEPKIREYLTNLRKTAFLEIKPGWVDTGAAPGMDTSWKDPAQLKPETVTKASVMEKKRHKRLFWVIPVPGTSETVTGKSSSR